MNASRAALPAMRIDLPSPHSRRLGEDFAPPRPLYFIHIPAILLVTALATWILSTEAAMLAASIVAAAVAVYQLWDWLLREGPTRFSTLLAMTLLLGYGLGSVNTWLTLPRGGLSLADFMGADEGILARGMAGVLLASAPLCFFGEFYERPLFGREFRIPLDQSTYSLIVLGAAAVVVGFFTNSLGYMGAQLTNGEQLSVASALLSWMLPPFTALTIAIFLVTTNRFAKFLTGTCMFVLCLFLMVVGRRVMIYTAIEALFALRLTGYRMKGTIFKKAVLLSILGAFLAVGLTAFMLIRLAGFQNSHNPNASLGQRIDIARGWVEDGSALTRANEANQSNLQKRTFVLAFLASVLEGSSQHTPALGRDFLGYTSMAIPRFFNPDKDLTFGEEALADSLFNLTYFDAANSILTNGATDFGILGAIAYPMLLVVLMRVCVEAFSRFLPALPTSIIALGAIFSLLQTENSIDAYLVTIRNEIIFAAILLIYTRLPKFGLQKP